MPHCRLRTASGRSEVRNEAKEREGKRREGREGKEGKGRKRREGREGKGREGKGGKGREGEGGEETTRTAKTAKTKPDTRKSEKNQVKTRQKVCVLNDYVRYDQLCFITSSDNLQRLSEAVLAFAIASLAPI